MAQFCSEISHNFWQAGGTPPLKLSHPDCACRPILAAGTAFRIFSKNHWHLLIYQVATGTFQTLSGIKNKYESHKVLARRPEGTLASTPKKTLPERTRTRLCRSEVKLRNKLPTNRRGMWQNTQTISKGNINGGGGRFDMCAQNLFELCISWLTVHSPALYVF